ncbi:MAG: FHA domain-containing protein [Myxococcales bacterium]|nr:FHA domain-containing protein [Myxococcales bacterium]
MLALLVRVDNLDDGTSKSFHFTRSPVRVGRNPLNDLPLKFGFVSQWHAVVQFDRSSVTFYDLGSTNGTVVGGQKLGKNVPVPVTHADMEFLLGRLRITFNLADVSEHQAQQDSLLQSVGFGQGQQGGHGHPSLEGDASSTMMLDAAAILEQTQNAGASRGGAGGYQSSQASRTPPAVARAMAQLRPGYAAWRQGWNELYNNLAATLRSMPPNQYAVAIEAFVEAFPEAAREQQLQSLAQSQGARVADPSAGGTASQLVTQLAQYLVPHQPPPQSAQEIEGFLVRILVALETFATAYAGLRRSHDEFGTEMIGVSRKVADPTPLDESNDPRQVLAYLVDWKADGDARLRALKGHFAEIMTHQVALLSGLMEGVRKLLNTRLSPTALAKGAEAAGGSQFWLFKDRANWQQFEKVHDELSEDRELTAAVFGRDFARAYNAALGENFADSDVRRVPSGGGR